MTPSDNFSEVFSEFFKNVKTLGGPVSQLWSDGFDFMLEARPGKRGVGVEKRQRLLRAAILTSAAAFEAFTNHLAGRIVQASEVPARKLTEFEMDCLSEKHRILEKGRIKENRKLYSAKDRFLLLFRLLTGDKEFPSDLLAELDNSFRIRDMLVHPKPGVSIDVSKDNMAEKVVFGFLKADLFLSRVWGGREFVPTPPGTFASLGQNVQSEARD